jgi:hypothetical protein
VCVPMTNTRELRLASDIKPELKGSGGRNS